ncbi:hypothetical protein CNMCM5793_006813 [Aspergillus hiratsukae]|uniref:Zn(2)-C6 fungal-type domain-containing protein n=1 Tax=Aspergillus hiratsukae TaxID=1194566 RepID=A0A8H6PKC3_9EURO|nr:hypothetical protein CNMCM5793_006813 [Aspergillus hiratsukae]KAF7156331.1 hypothetical protein CNMCM6106_009598 [Aspergillus hiratsukae]
MFTTLRYSQQGNKPIRIEKQCLATQWNSGRGQQHIACESCRAKKLRCSGQKTGCDRCKAKSAECVYMTNECTGSSPKADRNNGTARDSVLSSNSTTAEADRMTSVSSDPLGETQTGDNASNHPIHPSSDEGSLSFSRALENWKNKELEAESINYFDDMLVTLSEPTNADSECTAQTSFLSGGNQQKSDSANYSPSDQEPSMDWDRNLTRDAGALQQFASACMQPTMPPTVYGSSRPSMDHTPPPSRGEPTVLDPSMSLYAFSGIYGRRAMQSEATCRCLLDVRRVLETLVSNSTSSAQSVPPSVDSVLAFQKHAVEKCSFMLDCNYCQSSPDRVLMVVLLADKLLTEFESILAVLPGQSICSRPQQPGCDPEPAFDSCETADVLRGGGRRLFVGDYEIDSYNEWRSFVKMLVDLHAARLSRFIVRSKTWATTSGRDVPFTMFLKLERRFQTISEALVVRLLAQRNDEV